MTPPHVSGRTVARWVVYVIGVAGIAAIGAGIAVGYSASQELARQQANLSATQAELATKKSELTSVEGSLAETRTTHAALADKMVSLQATLDLRTACVHSRRADFAELDRISKLLSDNWNRTSIDSDFEKERKARHAALDGARDAYYQAVLKRFAGQISSANGWLAKASDFQTTADEKKAFMESVLAEVDATAGQIEAALTTLKSSLEASRATCAKTS